MKIPFPSPAKTRRPKSVHGSTSSPRTDVHARELKPLAVRPEPVEGRTANGDAE